MMKGQLFLKTTLLLVCSLFIVSSYAQNDDPPTLPNDPEGITDFLPLTLVSFSATLQNSTTQLYWKTTNEVNVRNFSIEKSNDGINFYAIATVNANNNLVNNYEFTDNSAIQQVAYYRLKMIDKDGSFQYSFIITLKSKVSNRLSVYPNPANNFVTVVHGAPIGNASISVIDVVGKKLQTILINSNVQQTSFTLNTVIKAGTYVLQYVDEKGVQNLQLIKR
jgi:hypothetical protein